MDAPGSVQTWPCH